MSVTSNFVKNYFSKETVQNFTFTCGAGLIAIPLFSISLKEGALIGVTTGTLTSVKQALQDKKGNATYQTLTTVFVFALTFFTTAAFMPSLNRFFSAKLTTESILKVLSLNLLGHLASLQHLSRHSPVTPSKPTKVTVQETPHPTPPLDDKEELRRLVFQYYNIPYTKFKRAYPPVGWGDTMRLDNNPKLKKELDNALQAYAKQHHIELPAQTTQSLFPRDPYSSRIATIFPELQGISKQGAHGYANSFQDEEILHIYPVIRQENFKDIPVRYTANNKPIIMQQATRGCTAAVTAMLIYEQTKQFDEHDVLYRNLGNDADKQRDFEKAKVPFITTECFSIEELQSQIIKNGSAIVSVDSCGAHVILVDEITEKSVRIRDPYHGWEIDIKRSAFEACWSKENRIFQVKRNH
jgi:hypothetical protein